MFDVDRLREAFPAGTTWEDVGDAVEFTYDDFVRGRVTAEDDEGVVAWARVEAERVVAYLCVGDDELKRASAGRLDDPTQTAIDLIALLLRGYSAIIYNMARNGRSTTPPSCKRFYDELRGA